MDNTDNYVSMKDVCTYLGCSRDTVIKMIKQKGMPAYKMDRHWKFKIEEIDQWMHETNVYL